MDKSDIIDKIEKRVNSTKSKKYEIWYIGITDNEMRRKDEHEKENIEFWKSWKTDSPEDAKYIEKQFFGKMKKMKGDTGGSKYPNCVYIF